MRNDPELMRCKIQVGILIDKCNYMHIYMAGIQRVACLQLSFSLAMLTQEFEVNASL